ncbi:DUF883 family protein [Noviherbaspirillum cavernae]|uniref:DUF883 family protein n=1 Tax=Noviherbaspirillum cavernae TaxID=2320862 RepID=A0A418X6C0_9BURK|nr:DUF883 family protein [Noviherbaspirillum cavernae]RJG08027.1 DUF883 family protein [Noviherbaspirillum cavernae]
MESTLHSSTPGNGSDAANAIKGAYREAKGAARRSAAEMRSDLSNIKHDLDALIDRAPSMSDDELTKAHAQMMQQFSSVRSTAKGLANEASRQFNRGMETTTEYVKGRPMQSVAVAVGTGLLLGFLLHRH